MKIVIAPDSFKECLAAEEVAEAMARGVRGALPEAEVVCVPMADGGEGTVRALVAATGGELRRARVTGPLGEPVEAEFGLFGDGRTAVIEMAAASGLPLVPPDRRDPTKTTTYGTGELIAAALGLGVECLILGIGGSATVDGGAGMAQALGARLLDAEGKPIGWGGGDLGRLATIDLSAMDPRLRGVACDVACDVTNPLTGPSGAAAVYGPQKGATPEMVELLDANLAHFARVAERDLGVAVRDVPGSGAAGGLGAGLMAFLGARLRPGVELVIQAVGLERKLRGAGLVLVGEGRMDAQTAYGKVPVGVARLARRMGIPAVAIVGSLGEGYEAVHAEGIVACFTILDRPMALQEAVRRARELIEATAEEVLLLFLNRKSEIGNQKS
ncbi:MAG: glycerate kinase [Planctomycetes bacterium]|nr:glycerate kinase [Planctomycetota bacterium]